MQIQITGKQLNIGEAFNEHINSTITNIVSKYFDDGRASAQITVSKEGRSFTAECALHLDSGMNLNSHFQNGDPYSSFDEAAEKLDKRLRRYKRRLKNHHQNNPTPIKMMEVSDVIIAASDDHSDEPSDLSPVIVSENTAKISELSVGEAVMQMDISDSPFLIFKNGSEDAINVVYRRSDGNIGWINPQD
ncbi:MAG: ribosome-associated translation inhibitor RaiA [Rhizobiales bacterium]|nr:ribosome-associated translation inhibitor RaiA [Hyphomicrobiales bacterium]